MLVVRIGRNQKLAKDTPSLLLLPMSSTKHTALAGTGGIELSVQPNWTYSRHTGLLIFVQPQEDELGVIQPSGWDLLEIVCVTKAVISRHEKGIPSSR